jgi:anti-sigma B factor antagonist
MVDPQSFFDSVAGRAAATRPFVCSRTEGGLDAAWVHVAGDLDIATTPQLVRALRESQSRARLVVLDLRELAFMDSSGVHAIVDASSRARQHGRRLLLLRGPAHIDRIFSLTGYSDEVETGDLGPVEPPAGSLQRSLVSASLLKTNGHANGGGPSHR